MKTTESVKLEIKGLLTEIKELEKLEDKNSIAKRKRLRKKLPELRMFLLYLESNPTADYLEKEKAKLQNRSAMIAKSYSPPPNSERFTLGQLSKIKRDFEKLHNLPKIKKQLIAVNYLLKSA